tara:strand:- start:470 stop:724 length:255 start_codon:yes stop_codon:yes gene_type:complete
MKSQTIQAKKPLKWNPGKSAKALLLPTAAIEPRSFYENDFSGLLRNNRLKFLAGRLACCIATCATCGRPWINKPYSKYATSLMA